MPVQESRELTEKERMLLQHLLAQGTPESGSYADQLPLVRVASRCGCGCPTVGLAVGGRGASPRSPSVILSEGGGVSPEGISFGIILHRRGSRPGGATVQRGPEVGNLSVDPALLPI